MVTVPLRARARPQSILADVFNVMSVSARILPANDVLVPSVAELPTLQKTVLPCPPFVNKTEELLAVVSVDPI